VGPTLEGGIPKAKPAKSAPAFWSSAEVQTWLGAEPPPASTLAPAEVRGPLLHEPRVHVAIDPETGTAKEGKLFQSDGLRFTERSDNGKWSRLALVVGCDHRELSSGFLPLGGERRVSALRPLTGSGPGWPAPKVLGCRARVMLLTPACFAEGAVPRQIGGARVIAAAVGRPQTISGWDMAAGGPKPARRLVPAGSVYWVDLSGLIPSDWCAAVHFQSVCSDKQDNLDGFGLAAVGVSA
jgi:CRISPR-associated protein Cmr3